MSEPSFTVTPNELVLLHRCLSSRICVRIFQVLRESGVLNISAISRKTGCTNNDGVRHLRTMVVLGVVDEEFYAGRHTFTLKRNDLVELMEKAIEELGS
jgi:predicted transcriptional regulator